MKTSELNGAALNWAVAKCEYPDWQWLHGEPDVWSTVRGIEIQTPSPDYETFSPSTDWGQGGPIVEREISKLFKNVGGTYTAQIRHEVSHPLVTHKVLSGCTNCAGPTPLIAAMRCYVASNLGDEVNIPKELVKQ